MRSRASSTSASSAELVRESFPLLAELRTRAQETMAVPAIERPSEGDQYAIAPLITKYGATHLQCTPSMLSLLVADQNDAASLGGLQHLMIGGEALSPALATETRQSLHGRFTNMYGPTETTVWSLVTSCRPARSTTSQLGGRSPTTPCTSSIRKAAKYRWAATANS